MILVNVIQNNYNDSESCIDSSTRKWQVNAAFDANIFHSLVFGAYFGRSDLYC